MGNSGEHYTYLSVPGKCQRIIFLLPSYCFCFLDLIMLFSQNIIQGFMHYAERYPAALQNKYGTTKKIFILCCDKVRTESKLFKLH